MTARRARLNGGRWHFQHGPIDLVIDAHGEPAAVARAHEAAWVRFSTVLEELVDELPVLRRPVHGACPLRGPIARSMWFACTTHSARFITPMAAVAGAVADALIGFYRPGGIRRAWINNGGDIALHLAPGGSARVGLFADLSRFNRRSASQIVLDGRFDVTDAMPVRGIATSGWRGRSFSFGIADSVTVLARTAAEADAAATMIANAVDVDDPRIVRRPASELKDDSDLGDRVVTVDVPALGVDVVRAALQAGLRRAEMLRAQGSIAACALVCQGAMLTTAPPCARPAAHRRAAGWHGARLDRLTTEAA